MAKDKKTTNPDEATQESAGTQSAETPQTVVGASAGDGDGTDNHPNPDRAASDAAEAEAERADQEGAEKAKAKRALKAEAAKATEPKVSDALAKAGLALLKSNPDMEVVYMTSDGQGFYARNDADNHARALKNKAVTPVKRK